MRIRSACSMPARMRALRVRRPSRWMPIRCALRCASAVRIRPRRLLRRCQCTVKTVSRRGLPRLLRRAARYRGLCAALLLLMLAVSVSSLFVWRIDVTGNEALTTGQILRCLDACGVRPGTYWPGLSNDLVRNDMILRLPQLRWLTVNVRGSCAEVIVREKDPLPDITPDDTPVSICAAATGVILHMDVYAGEARVAPGAAVEPGDVLVSGAVYVLGGGVRRCAPRRDPRRTRQELTGQIALTESEKQSAHGGRMRWRCAWGKNGSIFIKTVEFRTRNVIKSLVNILLRSGACLRCRFRSCASACSRTGRRTRRFRRTRRAQRSSRRCCSSCARRSGADGTILAYETAAEVTGGVLDRDAHGRVRAGDRPRAGDAGRGIFTASAAGRGRDYSR